jgi:hypothetical protein
VAARWLRRRQGAPSRGPWRRRSRRREGWRRGESNPNPRLAKLVRNVDTSHYQRRQFADSRREPPDALRLTVVRVTSRVTTPG